MSHKTHALTLSLTALVLAASAAAPALARNAQPPAGTTITGLSDGGALYQFADGKMAVESKYGRATPVKPGTTVTTKDGRQVTVTSSESARLDTLLRDGHPRN